MTRRRARARSGSATRSCVEQRGERLVSILEQLADDDDTIADRIGAQPEAAAFGRQPTPRRAVRSSTAPTSVTRVALSGHERRSCRRSRSPARRRPRLRGATASSACRLAATTERRAPRSGSRGRRRSARRGSSRGGRTGTRRALRARPPSRRRRRASAGAGSAAGSRLPSFRRRYPTPRTVSIERAPNGRSTFSRR